MTNKEALTRSWYFDVIFDNRELLFFLVLTGCYSSWIPIFQCCWCWSFLPLLYFWHHDMCWSQDQVMWANIFCLTCEITSELDVNRIRLQMYSFSELAHINHGHAQRMRNAHMRTGLHWTFSNKPTVSTAHFKWLRCDVFNVLCIRL